MRLLRPPQKNRQNGAEILPEVRENCLTIKIKITDMKIEHKQIKVGSRVRLLEDVEMFNCIYTKGHEFKVYGSSYRGWDLIDDDGNKIDECLFIHDKLELVKS